MDLSFSNIISAGALVYSIMQQKQLAETYENNLTDYKKELENYKNTIEANLAAADQTIKDFTNSQNSPIETATCTFIVDLAGIADIYWSSRASVTIQNNDKTNNIRLWAIVLDWGICDTDESEVTATWMQWMYFGKEQIIEPGHKITRNLYGTDHQMLYTEKSLRKKVRQIIKRGKNTLYKNNNTLYDGKGRVYLITLVGDGSMVKVSNPIEANGTIHYYNESAVLAGSNKHTRYTGGDALNHFKNGSSTDPA